MLRAREEGFGAGADKIQVPNLLDPSGRVIWAAGPAQAASQSDDALPRAVTAVAGNR